MSGGPGMSDVAQDPPGIDWRNLIWCALAIAGTVAVILADNRWLLNFIHVMCGVLWTGIDLFMGFVVGPVMRTLPPPARRAMARRTAATRPIRRCRVRVRNRSRTPAGARAGGGWTTATQHRPGSAATPPCHRPAAHRPDAVERCQAQPPAGDPSRRPGSGASDELRVGCHGRVQGLPRLGRAAPCSSSCSRNA